MEMICALPVQEIKICLFHITSTQIAIRVKSFPENEEEKLMWTKQGF